jgi:hypothetical protein
MPLPPNGSPNSPPAETAYFDFEVGSVGDFFWTAGNTERESDPIQEPGAHRADAQ